MLKQNSSLTKLKRNVCFFLCSSLTNLFLKGGKGTNKSISKYMVCVCVLVFECVPVFFKHGPLQRLAYSIFIICHHTYIYTKLDDGKRFMHKRFMGNCEWSHNFSVRSSGKKKEKNTHTNTVSLLNRLY